MQKCRSGAERVPTQFKSFWHPDKLLTNCLLMVLPVGRKKQASSVSLEPSIPIQASMVSFVLNLVYGISRLMNRVPKLLSGITDTCRPGHISQTGSKPQGIRRALFGRLVLGRYTQEC